MSSILVLEFAVPTTYEPLEFMDWETCMSFLNEVVYPYIVAHGIPMVWGYCT